MGGTRPEVLAETFLALPSSTDSSRMTGGSEAPSRDCDPGLVITHATGKDNAVYLNPVLSGPS